VSDDRLKQLHESAEAIGNGLLGPRIQGEQDPDVLERLLRELYQVGRSRMNGHGDQAIAIDLTTMQATDVEFLLDPFLPMKVIQLNGLKGELKSGFIQWCAASLSNGTNGFPVGKTLLMAGEDDIEDSILPRLILYGADLSMIKVLKMRSGRELLLPDDFIEFKRMTLEHRPTLAAIDPWLSHVTTKSGDAQALRLEVLADLKQMSNELRLCVLLNNHLNRTDTADPMARIASSWGIPMFSRSVLFFGAPANGDPDERILTVGEGNYGPKNQALVFKKKLEVPPGLKRLQAILELVREDVVPAGELQAFVKRKPGRPKDPKIREWLTGQLADGQPHEAGEIKAECEATTPHSWRAVQIVAFEELEVEVTKDPNDKRRHFWRWDQTKLFKRDAEVTTHA
jgi:hypothetical protein